jgi:adenine-specific DNA-methyltransferase
VAVPKKGAKKATKSEKRVTRYSYNDELEPRTPETGHTSLLPDEGRVVALPMDNGWTEAIDVGKLEDHDAPAIVDLDPVLDPVLFWSGKRSHRQVPVLPLQRNEIISESRIARIIDRARESARQPETEQQSLFSDLEKSFRESDRDRRVEFYVHEEGWKNKLICGDSLQVMESLVHYEDMAGKVQMIYVDPPYGIKYNSNFQQRIDSTKNDDKERVDDVLTIKAYNDTWALGIHSYLSYLQERLYLCRELLSTTGSIFVQINDVNVHLIRALLDEVFGRENFVSLITFQKTGSQESRLLGTTVDYLAWYAKSKEEVYYRQLYKPRRAGELALDRYDQIELEDGSTRALTADEKRGRAPIPAGKRFRFTSLQSSGETAGPQDFLFEGKKYRPRSGSHWKTTIPGLEQLAETGKGLQFKRYADDFAFVPIDDRWESMQVGRALDYVVQTSESVVERCLLMTTKPGDLVFDPTCGSGTSALAAERYGRRWITCDTSRVAINVSRQRLLSAVFDHFKTRNGSPSSGFMYRTADRVTLKSLAHGQEPEGIDLVDQPEVDPTALRVTGPLEAMTIGRYSLEDWKGYVFSEDGEQSRLENYLSVIARLYRPECAISESSGLIHAVVASEKERLAISVGPIAGRVTARQIHDAAQEASAGGIREVHVLGWAFEPNVGEIKDKAETYHKVQISLAMIRPDVLAEGLKVAKPETLFSPLALPDVEILREGSTCVIRLLGVAVFDRKERATKYMKADSGYVSAWYLDEDYDGDCLVDCQMFFDFKRKPVIEAALGIKVSSEEWKLRLESESFPTGKYRRVAARVVDIYGNESTVVKDL